ncbi:MAG: transpeptidase family protein [Crocinitomicaceae bacterium]|nr:transpeptidase family protein [Crocinitomicaceae bacterium]
MNEKKDVYWRAYLIYFGFVVLMLVVIFKTVSIQLDGGSSTVMSSASDEGKLPTRTVPRESRRGQILDANMSPLVTSVSSYNIYMDPTVIEQDVFDKDMGALCKALNKLYPEKSVNDYSTAIRSCRERGRRYLEIHLKATNEERKKLNKMPIFKLGRFKGGLIDNEEVVDRVLPHGEYLRRTLGYKNWGKEKKRWIKVGIEGAFDEFLKGERGREIEQKISTGWKRTGEITKEAVEGATIVTTIDLEIQEVAHTELLNQLFAEEAEKGCVIVMEVKTGYVKAIVNLVKADDGKYYESWNQAIGTPEVPGSTFKLASLMAALEDKKVKLSDRVNAHGVYRFYNNRMDDSNNGIGYGVITIQKAFEKSSNVFTEIINDAYKSNPSAYIRRLKQFGLDKKLGISLSGERGPVMNEPGDSQWSGISLPWMAVGYGFQQTPLQTLAFYNSVANNGIMLRPLFVKEIYRGKDLIKSFSPEVMNPQICSPSTIRDLQECLVGVMKRGTGRKINSAFFDIAGKTGTAHIIDNSVSGVKKKYQASFVGYFPAKDPIYSCIVVVSAPGKNIYGATVSGTVFTSIANKVYASSLKYHKPINQGKAVEGVPISVDGNSGDLIQCYKGLNIPYKMVEPSSWVSTKSQVDHVEMMRRYIGKETVPNVIGMTAKDAVYLMERAGLRAVVKGYGKVVSQSEVAGKEAIRGKRIQIVLK